jgi:hypothetical protein
MGTRISLGKGFTIGRSGLRYGRSIPGVPRGYVSTGRSGTLITGAHLRHWEPNRRQGTPAATAAAGRCGGTLASGGRCTNSATQGLVCRRHLAQLDAVQAAVLAARPASAADRMAATGNPWDPDSPSRAVRRAHRNREGWIRLGISPRVSGIFGLIVLALVVWAIWAPFHVQAQNHATDQASGLARAAATGAPGICIDDDVNNLGVSIPPGGPDEGTLADGHYYWKVSTTGMCDPNLREHFVSAN